VHDFKSLYPLVKYDPDMPVIPVRWLVDGLWQLGKINGIAGYEKSGKSRLMNWLLVGMSKGEVLGLPAMPQKVLYLCGEETVSHCNQRITRYAELQEIPRTMFDINFVEAAGMRLDLKPQRKALLEMILDSDSEMLVIDPVRRVHSADENDNTVMAAILNDLRRWSNKYSLTVLLVHHTSKISQETDMTRIASWFRGATDLPAILDTAQYVDRLNKKRIQVLRQGRFPPLDPLIVEDLGGSKLNDDRGFKRAN
jgi:RecA-family ATPase